MKINEEAQKKQSDQPRNKIVFNWFQKINRLFMESTDCFYRQFIKTQFKQF